MTVTPERATELMFALFGSDDVDMAQGMIPTMAAACTRYAITPLDLLQFANDIERYIALQQPETNLQDSDRRTRALSTMIALSGGSLLRTPAEVIAEGRQMNWTRLTLALGDGTLGGLATYGLLSTGMAATRMVAHQALLHGASLKVAATTGAKIKGGALALGAGMGATVLASLTLSAGVLSVGYWYTTIQAYRDVFDNEIGRDAYLFHRLKAHGVVPGEVANPCRHDNLAFTSPNMRLAAYLAGKRAN